LAQTKRRNVHQFHWPFVSRRSVSSIRLRFIDQYTRNKGLFQAWSCYSYSVRKGCAVMRKRSLIYLSHGPLGLLTTWKFIPTIHPSPSSVLNFQVSNICLCHPTSPSRLTNTQNYVPSTFAFRLREIRLCLPSQENTSLHSASVLAFLFWDTSVRTINLAEGGPIRLSFPSQGHPPAPSACASRLGDIPLGLPSRGQPEIQHKQIHLMITHRAALTND